MYIYIYIEREICARASLRQCLDSCINGLQETQTPLIKGVDAAAPTRKALQVSCFELSAMRRPPTAHAQAQLAHQRPTATSADAMLAAQHALKHTLPAPAQLACRELKLAINSPEWHDCQS